MTKQEIFTNLYTKLGQLSLTENQKNLLLSIDNACKNNQSLDVQYQPTVADNTNSWTNAALQYLIRALLASNVHFELFCYDFCNHLAGFAEKLESKQKNETIRNLQVLETNQSSSEPTTTNVGAD